MGVLVGVELPGDVGEEESDPQADIRTATPAKRRVVRTSVKLANARSLTKNLRDDPIPTLSRRQKALLVHRERPEKGL
jgi:hypothetical protein